MHSGCDIWLTAETAGSLVFGADSIPPKPPAFFLLGALGLGGNDLAASGYGSAGETGAGPHLGLGWGIPISTSASLTLFWNGIGISTSPAMPTSDSSASGSPSTEPVTPQAHR